MLVAAIVVIAGYMALSFLAIHVLHSQQGERLTNVFCIDNNMTLSISVLYIWEVSHDQHLLWISPH